MSIEQFIAITLFLSAVVGQATDGPGRAEHVTIKPNYGVTDVEPQWPSLGGNYARTGLSENDGLAEGGLQWRYDTGSAVINSITIGFDGSIHIACEDGRLSTLSAEGVLLWAVDVNTPLLSAPSIGPDGSVFVGGKAGSIYAVAPNGEIRWTHDTGDAAYSSPAVGASGNVYIGSTDGTLYTLDPNGSERWRFTTKGPSSLEAGAIFASPAIGPDGTIYVGGIYDPNLYALDPATGVVKWRCNFELYSEDALDPNSPPMGGWPFASPVVGPDGTIYQTLLFDQCLYAIEPETGTILWAADLYDTPAIEVGPETFGIYADGWSEPALGPDGTIYVSLDDPYLRAVDPTGTIKWATKLGEMGGFTLTVDRTGVIYAACDDGNIYVVDPDGTLIGRFATEGWPVYPVVASDGTLIVTDSRDNSLLFTEAVNAVQAMTVDALSDGAGQ